MFRDECEITVTAGRGGDGLCSFRREKYVPKGGPDGGDGGDGGSVILVADSSINSLLKLSRQPKHAAKNGQPGGSRLSTGRGGADLVIEVPVGTQIRDAEHGNLLRDLDQDGQRLVLARGGKGGRGNTAFATPTHQTPRRYEEGRPGEVRRVTLELKLVAEVGLVGLPNAGKSTFLSAISRATPKIADYPFTTLQPQVGIAAVGDFDTLVVADLPGLIEGAAEGHGLGHQFLRHVERCQVLLHLVDVSESASEEPETALRTIESELQQYSPELAGRERLIVATKVESDESEERAAALEASIGRPVWRLSASTGRGVEELLLAARERVRGTQEVF
ncbi:GTPase ObgE [Engelhardtia mirabilis]|uniref:GTPase Obg n=1 Tax=Engelhardtia mirabilis TaxID=2528011 RepID=A0A518BP91_9BACT|nr:GTPase Obg [Planctomycetes bacterium Pla133]QDV03122.1 GTPase Obg [Planctomycetes bacterium Pla86]